MPRSMTSCWRDFTHYHPLIAAFINNIQIILPPLNFITIHYAYFISVTLVTSVIFLGLVKSGLFHQLCRQSIPHRLGYD